MFHDEQLLIIIKKQYLEAHSMDGDKSNQNQIKTFSAAKPQPGGGMHNHSGEDVPTLNANTREMNRITPIENARNPLKNRSWEWCSICWCCATLTVPPKRLQGRQGCKTFARKSAYMKKGFCRLRAHKLRFRAGPPKNELPPKWGKPRRHRHEQNTVARLRVKPPVWTG